MGERESPKRLLASKLARIARRLRLQFDYRAEQLGITRAQWTVIAVIARNPGATQRTIATLLEITEVTAGRLIDRLCAEGYLERLENPDDRRAYRVFLTKAAHPTLEQLGNLAAVYEEDIFAGFSQQDLVKFGQLLKLMAGNMAREQSREGEDKRCA